MRFAQACTEPESSSLQENKITGADSLHRSLHEDAPQPSFPRLIAALLSTLFLLLQSYRNWQLPASGVDD